MGAADYFDMGIFLAFFILFCVVCVVVVLKVRATGVVTVRVGWLRGLGRVGVIMRVGGGGGDYEGWR